jgi:ABC-type phosphate/phosphonate transport system substrate-binding protein
VRVSFPMYDLPELLDDHQQIWNGLRRLLREDGFPNLPAALDWPEDLGSHWRSRDLLLSQTCGYPLIRHLAGQVQLVGVPHYDAPGCDGYRYSSALIVNRKSSFHELADLRGAVAGFNESGSQSGYNALRHAVAHVANGAPFFAAVKRTGRHEASIDAVAEGAIDIAAIDAVTYALIARYQSTRVSALRVLGFTAPVPGLPLITSLDMPVSQLPGLRRALEKLVSDPTLEGNRERLLLTGISFPPLSVYQALAEQEAAASALGYPVLA